MHSLKWNDFGLNRVSLESRHGVSQTCAPDRLYFLQFEFSNVSNPSVCHLHQRALTGLPEPAVRSKAQVLRRRNKRELFVQGVIEKQKQLQDTF